MSGTGRLEPVDCRLGSAKSGSPYGSPKAVVQLCDRPEAEG